MPFRPAPEQLRRANGAVAEWHESRAWGLDQGFTLLHLPERGDGPLRLLLNTWGDPLPHPHVRLKTGQHPRRMIVQQQFAAEFQIQLVIGAVDAFKNRGALLVEIKLVVEASGCGQSDCGAIAELLQGYCTALIRLLHSDCTALQRLLHGSSRATPKRRERVAEYRKRSGLADA